MRLPDCQGGSFTSPPCGEDLCRSWGPGEEALSRQHEDEQDARDRMEADMSVTPTYLVPVSDTEDTEWWCQIRVTTWGRPAVLRGVPMIDRHPEEPAEYEVLSVSRTVHGISVSEVIEHPDPAAFAKENAEEIWNWLHELRQAEQEAHRV